MFNPDSEDSPVEKKKPYGYPTTPVGGVRLKTELENFSYYLDESLEIRKRWGIGTHGDKYYIENLAIISKLDEALKSLLRQWVMLKKAQGKWDGERSGRTSGLQTTSDTPREAGEANVQASEHHGDSEEGIEPGSFS